MNSEDKEALMDFVESLDDEGVGKFWKFINENFELVETEYDKQAFERGRQEVKEGKYEFI